MSILGALTFKSFATSSLALKSEVPPALIMIFRFYMSSSATFGDNPISFCE